MEINRCVCTNRTFAELQREAIERGIEDPAALMEQTGCGRQCGRCQPYIHAMMRTGQTTFNRILSDPPDQKAG